MQALTEGVGDVDWRGIIDEDGLRIHLLLLRPLVLVLQQGMERWRRSWRPRRQLTLLEVLVLCVCVRHVVVLLAALPAATIPWNGQKG